jgi:hypothetical protein
MPEEWSVLCRSAEDSGADGPVAGGFVVGAGVGVVVALDEVDDAEDGVDGGVGNDAKAGCGLIFELMGAMAR